MSPNLGTVSAAETGLHTADTDEHFLWESLNQGNRSGRGALAGFPKSHVPSVPVAPLTGAWSCWRPEPALPPTSRKGAAGHPHLHVTAEQREQVGARRQPALPAGRTRPLRSAAVCRHRQGSGLPEWP